MRRTIRVWQVGRTDNGRAHQSAGQRHRGFSHPARFEALEPRLTLNVAPGGPDVAPVTPLIASGGVSGVSGDSGATVGTNPANYSPVNTNQSIVATEGYVLENQEVAFNTPYWVPNDRVQLANPPGAHLPANVNQEAPTPFGIRNFSFGPDTSTHFTTPGVTLISRRPTAGEEGGNRAASDLPEDTLLVDTVLSEDALVLRRNEQPPSATELAKEDYAPAYAEDVEVPSVAVVESSPRELTLESFDETHGKPVHLQETAVDKMMADQREADLATADAAIAQIMADASSAEDQDQSGPARVAHALAASIVSATVLPMREQAEDKSNFRPTGMCRSAST